MRFFYSPAEAIARLGHYQAGVYAGRHWQALRLCLGTAYGFDETTSRRNLHFPGLLTHIGLNGPQQAAVIGSIIARMAVPGPEQATYRWLQDHSALGELIDFDYESMGAMALYRASDRLYRHRDTL